MNIGEMEARVREYRRVADAATRFAEFVESHLRELADKKDQETARGLMNRFTSELAGMSPQKEKRVLLVLTAEQAEFLEDTLRQTRDEGTQYGDGGWQSDELGALRSIVERAVKEAQ